MRRMPDAMEERLAEFEVEISEWLSKTSKFDPDSGCRALASALKG